MKRCINPNCGAELEDSAKFCLECGTKQPQEYVCPACGAKFEQPSKFCMECGAKMDGSGGAPKASGMSIGDNNAISAKDIIAGDHIEAQNYTVTNVMGPQKSEAEYKMENLSMKKMSKEYIREEMAKAKDYESHIDYYHAVSVYRELAADDNVDAVCALLSLDYNKQFTIDAAERNNLMNKLKEVMDSGHPEALFILGVNLLESDYARGMDYLDRAVQNGSKKAVGFLDKYYGYNDDGTRKEVTEEAFRWFEKSADMGSAEGQYLLACCYHNGYIVEKSPKDAYDWFGKSASNQHPYATYMVGEYYYHGWWPTINRNIAKDYFLKAAEQGVTEAQFCYGEICYKDKNYSEAEKWLKPAADKGNMVAQYYMGDLCDAWNKINAEKALVWFKKSAAQGYMPAFTSIGCIFMYEHCGMVDYNEAEKWLKPAAESGDEFAQSQYGVCCANHYDLSEAGIKEAGKYLRMAADRGDEEAIDTIKDCYLELDYGWDMKAIDWLAGKVEKDPEVWGWAKKMIGRCYSDLIKYGYSDGTELNEEEKQYAKQQAQKWGTGISSSILASHREAQQTTSQPAPTPAPAKTTTESYTKEELDHLDKKYGFNDDGKSFREITEEAYKWFEKSANLGSAMGQFLLGRCYYNGFIVNKNYDEALKWFSKSAEQGVSYAYNNLGNMYLNGFGVPLNYDKAMEFYTLAGLKGNVFALTNIGDMYYFGVGVGQDYQEAFKFYCAAAEKDDNYAHSMLGHMYYEGEGVKKDHQEALKYARKAAEHGDSNAQNLMGVLYDTGEVVKQDYQEAFKWYKKAAEQGCDAAICNLGDYYYDGIVVTKDIDKAIEYYQKAADKGNDTAKQRLEKIKKDNKKGFFGKIFK